MPRTIAPYGRLREECRVAFHHGRPASVEPADILLLLDRITALEAVAKAAGAVFDPSDHGEPMLLPEWKRLDRALSRLDRLSNPPPRARRRKR